MFDSWARYYSTLNRAMSETEKIEVLKQKTQERLLMACKRLYDAELALCELTVPQSLKDEYGNAYTEWIEAYQDYDEVRTALSLKDMELNFDYKLD